MVFFFVARDGSVLYMGRDKTENELLIKYGMPEDVWFHVDSMSSAHVYLRRKRGQNTLEGIDPGLLQDCAQLVKHNSIKGRKLPDVKVSYTLWSNLRKTGDMVEGQIGFHRPKAVMKVHVERDREVVKRLLKTMTERMIKLFFFSLSLSPFKKFIIYFFPKAILISFKKNKIVKSWNNKKQDKQQQQCGLQSRRQSKSPRKRPSSSPTNPCSTISVHRTLTRALTEPRTLKSTKTTLCEQEKKQLQIQFKNNYKKIRLIFLDFPGLL